MAKDKNTQAMELTVESLMAMGYDEQSAKDIVGASSSGSGTGLPFQQLKLNYDPDLELAKRGEWIADIEKDDKGNVTKLTNFGETINLVILGSKYQYSKYDSVTNKAVVSSNIFDMADIKQAFDLSSGISIKTLKESDPENKIKFQEVMVVLAYSDKVPEKKVYILYSKGAFMFSLNQGRKPFPNGGNMMFTLSFGLERQKNGSTVYFTVDQGTFKATPRSIEDIKDGVKTIPSYIKQFNDWVSAVNAGGSSSSSDKKTKASPKVSDAPFDEDEDDVNFS